HALSPRRSAVNDRDTAHRLDNPSETERTIRERRPLKCQAILPNPPSSSDTRFPHCLFLTEGTWYRISSLMHGGSVPVRTMAQNSQSAGSAGDGHSVSNSYPARGQ
ncbi:NAD(P)H-quinone oxidoreductase subunit O, partial [Dissostichus eleginoides]